MKNVVLLTIDTLRKDVLGCYGSHLNLTPNLDELARCALVYTNHISAGPYTQASFPAILTSSYFLEFGEPKKLSDRRTVVSEVVKRGGFTTAAFHSNPYISTYLGWNRGDVIDAVLSGVDIAPTICHLFGLAGAKGWHGQSLLPTSSYCRKGPSVKPSAN